MQRVHLAKQIGGLLGIQIVVRKQVVQECHTDFTVAEVQGELRLEIVPVLALESCMVHHCGREYERLLRGSRIF